MIIVNLNIIFAISGKWMVLLDAAKGCGTSQLDLSKYPADFVTISFYKVCVPFAIFFLFDMLWSHFNAATNHAGRCLDIQQV